jgi:Est1 DNA/RNA binding domain
MRRARFTLRCLMLTVAVVAVVLAAWVETVRLARISSARRHYAESCAASAALANKFALRYRQHAQAAQVELDSLQTRPVANLGPVPPEDRAAQERFAALQMAKTWEGILERAQSTAATYARNSDHWSRMHQKYARAARTPWLSIDPDPPAPY